MILDTVADLDAEHALAAIAADSADGARRARARGIGREHFSVPPLGRVYAVAGTVDDLSHEDRLAAIAEQAQVDPDWLLDLTLAARRCMRDEAGSYALRVFASAERVRQYQHHVRALAGLGIAVAA